MQEDVPGHVYYKWRQNVDLDMYQRGLTGIDENDKVVDPAAKIEEWSDDYGTYKGMKMPDGKRQGIARRVYSKEIWLSQYKNNELHGLSIAWFAGRINVWLYKNE